MEKKNKDGLIPGQLVSEKEYWAAVNKAKAKPEQKTKAKAKPEQKE